MTELLEQMQMIVRYLAHGEGTQRGALNAARLVFRSLERRKTQVDDLKAEIEQWREVDAIWQKTVADGIANEERQANERDTLRRQLAEAQAEHRALWDAAIAFINTPGQVSQSGGEDEAYAALVRCFEFGEGAIQIAESVTPWHSALTQRPEGQPAAPQR